MRRSQRLQHRSSEAGSISGMFVVLAVSVVLMVGLVVDGGRLMTNRRDATDAANEAARAAAQSISESTYATGGGLEIDETDARRRAEIVASASHVKITEFRTPNGHVFITVTRVIELPMLALLGVPRRTVVAHGESEARPGLESEG
jgi:Flp pilus assembly protein TadG